MQNQEKFYGNWNEDRCSVLGQVPADKISIQVLNEIFRQKFGYYFPCNDGKVQVVARKIKLQRKEN